MKISSRTKLDNDVHKRDTQIKFQFKYHKRFDLFFNIIPNPGYDSVMDGEINRHRPSLLESKLDDINSKLIYLSIIYENIDTLVTQINQKYDDKFLELEYEWDTLHILFGYFLHISKSITYLYARTFQILYPNLNLNESLEKQIKNINSVTQTNHNSQKYIDLIHKLEKSSWIRYIFVGERKTSMRDLDTHYSSIKIRILPNRQAKKYNFDVFLSYGVDTFMPKYALKSNLCECTNVIKEGLFGFTNIFIKEFPKDIILSLLK